MKQLQSKIAIVIPVYNTEKFLPECLNSILKQTHKNFTVFAIDDCSTDNSLKILKEYQKLDSRIVIIKQSKNGGVSQARNAALCEIEKNKSFDYISFCDSDDIIAPTMLEELSSAAISENAQISGCHFKQIGSRSDDAQKTENYCSYGPESFIEQIFSLGKWRKTKGRGGYSCIRLFDANTIKGIRFREYKDINEDEMFCVEAATRAVKITHIPQPLYLYRYRSDSLSRSNSFSRKLCLARINCLPLTEKLSPYASVLNACAIAKKLKSNSNLLNKQLIKKLSPLLKEGYSLKLISLREYLRFRIFSFFVTLKGK